MFFTNINLKASTLKILAIATSLLGIIFIIAAGYIGNLAIRLVTVAVILFFLLNIKMTYHYSGKLKKLTDILCLIGAAVVFIFPQFAVFIIGAALLYFSGITLFQMFKKKDYDDKIKLIVSIVTAVLSIFCIFNSKATLELVIRLIGAIFLAVGCICFYHYITKSKKDEIIQPDYKFENSEKIVEVIEVEEVKVERNDE